MFTSAVANELVMFDKDAGKYYGLNEVATTIWNQLVSAMSVEDLCASLTTEFEISMEQCRQEVLDFLPHLREKGLIEEIQH